MRSPEEEVMGMLWVWAADLTLAGAIGAPPDVQMAGYGLLVFAAVLETLAFVI